MIRFHALAPVPTRE